MNVSDINSAFAGLTLLGQVILVLIIAAYAINRRTWLAWFSPRYAMFFAFLVALCGVVISLFYSEIIGYDPCELCWVQRIFMYPQVVLLGMALLKKDPRISDYSIALAVCGGLVALYQYYGQMFQASALPCAVSTTIPSCAQIFFTAFGYITIPLMSATAFALLIVFMLMSKRSQSSHD